MYICGERSSTSSSSCASIIACRYGNSRDTDAQLGRPEYTQQLGNGLQDESIERFDHQPVEASRSNGRKADRSCIVCETENIGDFLNDCLSHPRDSGSPCKNPHRPSKEELQEGNFFKECLSSPGLREPDGEEYLQTSPRRKSERLLPRDEELLSCSEPTDCVRFELLEQPSPTRCSRVPQAHSGRGKTHYEFRPTPLLDLSQRRMSRSMSPVGSDEQEEQIPTARTDCSRSSQPESEPQHQGRRSPQTPSAYPDSPEMRPVFSHHMYAESICIGSPKLHPARSRNSSLGEQYEIMGCLSPNTKFYSLHAVDNLPMTSNRSRYDGDRPAFELKSEFLRSRPQNGGRASHRAVPVSRTQRTANRSKTHTDRTDEVEWYNRDFKMTSL